jgi:hypothetical protein
MGQIHPQGPNVVGLIQHGGGKNCDCGPPHFDKSYYDARFGVLGISQPEFNDKVEQTNRVLKENSLNLPKFIIAIVILAILPNLLFRWIDPAELTDGGCGKSIGNFSRRKTYDRQFSCPNPKANSTLIWPDRKNDMRNCGDTEEMVNSYCSKDENPDCYEHVVGMCCEGDFDDSDEYDERKQSKQRKKIQRCDDGFPVQMIITLLPAFFVIFILVRICNARKIVDRKVQELFMDWKTKGIGVVYRHASKHAHGRLSFVLPTGMTNRQPMVAPMVVVGQVQSVGHQPLQNQQMVPMQASSVAVVQPNVVQPNVVQPNVFGGVAVQPIQPLMPMATPMPVQGGMQQQPTLVPNPVPIQVARA